MNAAMFCGFDVVLHVANEQRLVSVELVLREDFMDAFAFVPYAEVGPLNELIEPEHLGLHFIMIGMNGAQEESADPFRCAELEELAGMGQGHDSMLHFLELAVEPGLKLWHRYMGKIPVVEGGERKREFGPKLIDGPLGQSGLR